MVFSKDMKSPTATALSTVSAEAGEHEQEDASSGQPGPAGLFASYASTSPSLPSSPSSPAHNNVWEAELETRLLAEMKRVTQGYTLLPVRPAMNTLQTMLRDDASKLPHTKDIRKIVTLLEQLIAELERFHSRDKNPTVKQREAQRTVARLVTRVPEGLIAAMQVFREGGPLTPESSPQEIYWAVEKANAAQEEVREVGKALKKMGSFHRNELMSGEKPQLSPMLILAKQLGAALLTLEDRLIADQNAYSTKAQRKTWTGMRDALKEQQLSHPESVEALMSDIARLHDTLASGNTPRTQAYRSLSALVGHICDIRAQNPRELHAISMLAALALDVGSVMRSTATGDVGSDIEGAEETATAAAIKQALDAVIKDIDTVSLFLFESGKAGALKNMPLFEARDLLHTLKGNLSSLNVKVTRQIAFDAREQRRVSLETLCETLTSTAEADPKTSGEWGIAGLIKVAGALLSLEGEEDRRNDAALAILAGTLEKAVNGVLSARTMMSAVPREDDNTMPVTAKMLEYAENQARKGAAQAQALVISRSNQSGGLVVPLLMRDNFKAVAGRLQAAWSHLSSETYLQKTTRKLQRQGRVAGHIVNKVVSAVSHTQLKYDKWKVATLPWARAYARPVAADIQPSLRAGVYPVIEALTVLRMAAELEHESLKFRRQYGSTGRSKDMHYDAESRERYRQASVKTGRAFPWVQEKIAEFMSTLTMPSVRPLDAGATAAVQEFMADVIPQLAHVDRLSTAWDAARKQQSREGMGEVIRKIGDITSAIKKAAELSVGAPQSIHADENKRVRYLGEFLAAEKAKHLAEHPQEGARFDKKVTALLQQHAAELAPAKYGDMVHLLQDAYIAADNNMQLQLPTTEDVVKTMPGFWTKLAGSGPQSLLRKTGRMAVSGTADMLFVLSGAKVVSSVALKSLMFAYTLYRAGSALERARKPWDPADVTTAARWAVTDTLFRQFLFRITKSVLPLGALRILLPVGQTVYLLTRGDGTTLLSEKLTAGRVAKEAGWEGGSKGISLASDGLTVSDAPERISRKPRHVPRGSTESEPSLPRPAVFSGGSRTGNGLTLKQGYNNGATSMSRFDQISYSRYRDLPESAKNKTYLYAINYILEEIKHDESIPNVAKRNAYLASIGESKVVPVDIGGYTYTNVFFIPDSPGSKQGILVNLNSEEKPYIYIKSGKDIPSNFEYNVLAGSLDPTWEADGDYFMIADIPRSKDLFNTLRRGEDGELFNHKNPRVLDIYALSEKLANDIGKKYAKEPLVDHNENVLKKAIVGSEIPEPEVRAAPVNMTVTWAGLSFSEYLRSFAQPFSTLGGQLQQIASYASGDDIQTTDQKVKHAKYVGSWADVTVGAIQTASGAGMVLGVAQSAAGVAADIAAGKAPDPLDVAGLVLSATPAGKISARIGKFSKVGGKGVKYTLEIGETIVDLADIGRGIKTAVETGDPLAIYQALIGTGMGMKGAKDIYESVKQTSNVKKGEMTINAQVDTNITPTNKDVITAPVRAVKKKWSAHRKFHFGNKDIIGRKRGRNFEISFDGGVNWKEGNNVQMLAFALQNAGGVPKLPTDRGGSNDNVEQGRGAGSPDMNEESHNNQEMEMGLNRHLEDEKDPEGYFHEIKKISPEAKVVNFKFFNKSLSGWVKEGVFQVSRDGGLTWKKGWWLQEAVWRIKFLGGKRKEILSEDLDKKINKASKKDPGAYSLSCYIAAFNDAAQAGVINAKQAQWLKNTVAKRDGRGEILDSQHYREAFGLQSKKPLTTFNSANITESGFMHIGERRPDGTVHYDHVVYVNVANNEIHLYQVNGSEFLLTLNGSDANHKNNNIGEHTSKSHYKHHMNEDRIRLFNKYFENDDGKDGSQPVFVFTPASEVQKKYTERYSSEVVSPNGNANGVGNDLNAQKVNAETSKHSMPSTISESNNKKNIMDITRGMPDLENTLAQPNEKCESSTDKLKGILKQTYPNTQRVQLLFFRKVDEDATNHFAVRVTIDGKHYISDPTISQFRKNAPDVIGDKEVFVGTESEWLDRMKAAHPNQVVVKSESSTPQNNVRFENAKGVVLVQPEWANKQFSVGGLLVRGKTWIRSLRIYKNNERFKKAVSSDRFKRAEERTFFSNPPEKVYKGLGLNVMLFKRVSMRSQNKRLSMLTSKQTLENVSMKQREHQIQCLGDMENALTDELKSIDLNSIQLNYIDDLTLALMDVQIRSTQLKLGLFPVNG